MSSRSSPCSWGSEREDTTSFDVTPAAAPSVSAGAGPAKRDFFFQVAGYRTRNQGSQTINLYFHYRYLIRNSLGSFVEDVADVPGAEVSAHDVGLALS
ncbi:hypothetical protein ACIP6P_32700, partial [Streptomyces sp. NPDC088729]|uniref:hypothetical protein n=1 Tax=Streptomyces sp. NPDC088729 TaxID=3365876 RepID=UPI00380D5044